MRTQQEKIWLELRNAELHLKAAIIGALGKAWQQINSLDDEVLECPSCHATGQSTIFHRIN